MKLTQANLPGKANKRRKIRHYAHSAATVSTLVTGTQHSLVEVESREQVWEGEREVTRSPRLNLGEGKETHLEGLHGGRLILSGLGREAVSRHVPSNSWCSS